MADMAAVFLAEGDLRSAWAPVALMAAIAAAFVIGTIALSIFTGPRRTGPGKASVYESGMVPAGDTHRPFYARFYLVAIIFVVFDVEIVFFYPWAAAFAHAAVERAAPAGALLAGMAGFVLILLAAYLYAWGKGVFRTD